jgi:hypothetical protein
MDSLIKSALKRLRHPDEVFVTMTHDEWCRKNGVTPEYALCFTSWLNYDFNHGLDKQKVTKKMADAWVNEVLN